MGNKLVNKIISNLNFCNDRTKPIEYFAPPLGKDRSTYGKRAKDEIRQAIWQPVYGLANIGFGIYEVLAGITIPPNWGSGLVVQGVVRVFVGIIQIVSALPQFMACPFVAAIPESKAKPEDMSQSVSPTSSELTMQQKCKVLQQENGNLQQKCKVLQQDKNELHKENCNLQTGNNKLEQENRNLRQEIRRLQMPIAA